MDTRAEAGYAASWTTKGSSGEKTVTEAEWLACTDPQPMLELLRGRATARRRRLLACACCRLIWPALHFACWRSVVEVVERFADGTATHAERQAVLKEADRIWNKTSRGHSPLSAYAAMEYASYHDASHANTSSALRHVALTDPSTVPIQAMLVRCVFGNPVRPITLSPAVLAWNDGVVVRLAQAAYEERHLPEGTLDKTRLLILADALEEAGCTDVDILGHLRGPGPHVQSCGVVDLVLGKS
jgi:hypothetical protein